MGILRVINLHKAFGAETLFAGVSFELKRGEKVGLIGANGAGKTTLLRCLLGEEAYDAGQVLLPAGETVGYVEQDCRFEHNTLYQELLSAYRDVLAWQEELRRLEAAAEAERDAAVLEDIMAQYAKALARFEHGGGYAYENNIRRVAAGLGFSPEDFEREVATFSGGQKTRIALAKALLRQPDFLFLDEPTNHQDIGMVEWLEGYLKEYAGGVLLISHDRYFLDQVVERVLDLEDKGIVEYKGNYSRYLAQKAERCEAQLKAYAKQQAYIAKNQAFIDRYRAGVKAKQARGRQSQLDRLQRIHAPVENNGFAFNFINVAASAERVAELEAVTAAYDGKVVFANQSLLIRRGEGLALIGPNGAGKTTLLKLLTGELPAAAGRVKLGSRVKLGYFSQEHEGLDPQRKVIEEVMFDFGLNEERARGYLGAFLFSGDDVFKLVADLSGGEKARLSLLKLMLAGPNFLLLDEPTNHLDIPAKEAVEAAILSYPGTYLIVSHDRYFLDKIADRVIELEDGAITEYAGNYSYYREKKAAAKPEPVAEKPAAAAAGREAPAALRPAGARKRPQDLARLVEKLEMTIRELEYEVKYLEQRLNDPATHRDPAASRAAYEEYAAKKAELDAKYSEWLEATAEV
ncbi:MAG: ABC-F family ATP-binding cassette domain-containing protein [Negativicutes bacterium]|nr:ABC-F family ATP-binding cassette domain-containing protein [Negativicutes bacterium]